MMISNSIYDQFRSMEDGNVILSFKGEITENMVNAFLVLVESRLESQEFNPQLRKKVFNVLVECLQNVYHHAGNDQTEKEDRQALVMLVGKKEGGYCIQTGNFVLAQSANTLTQRIQEINQMDSDQLREAYRTRLNNAVMSAKGTAGLGMIDIARKSGNTLDYALTPVDEQKSFFTLHVTIEDK